MPSVKEEYQKARIKAFDVAINALQKELDTIKFSYEERYELKGFIERLGREKMKFIERFEIEYR